MRPQILVEGHDRSIRSWAAVAASSFSRRRVSDAGWLLYWASES